MQKCKNCNARFLPSTLQEGEDASYCSFRCSLEHAKRKELHRMKNPVVDVPKGGDPWQQPSSVSVSSARSKSP